MIFIVVVCVNTRKIKASKNELLLFNLKYKQHTYTNTK